MIKKIFTLFLIGLLFACSKGSRHDDILVGYWSYPKALDLQHFFASYPIPGSFNDFGKSAANPDLQRKLNYLDVIVYAYVHADSNGIVHFRNSEIDLSAENLAFCSTHPLICSDDQGKTIPKYGNFSAFAKLDNQTHTLKKVISVFEDSVYRGGTREGKLQDVFDHIPAFVDSLASIVESFHLDGVDLDIEPDSFTPEQGLKYAELISQLRAKLGSNKIIFTTVSADQNIKREAWSIISKNTTYVSDMCYDFHSPFFSPHFTGYNSNLYSDPNEPLMDGYFHISCDQSIKQLTFLGVPAHKIILGYPSYGIIYGGVSEKHRGLFQAFDPKKTPNNYNGMKIHGQLPYHEISELLQKGFTSFTTFYNQHLSANWAYNFSTHEFIAYDSPELVHEKHDYVRKNNLAGMMTWQLSDDAPVASGDSLLVAARSSRQ